MRADAEHRREKEGKKRCTTESHPDTSHSTGCANARLPLLHPSQ